MKKIKKIPSIYISYFGGIIFLTFIFEAAFILPNILPSLHFLKLQNTDTAYQHFFSTLAGISTAIFPFMIFMVNQNEDKNKLRVLLDKTNILYLEFWIILLFILLLINNEVNYLVMFLFVPLGIFIIKVILDVVLISTSNSFYFFCEKIFLNKKLEETIKIEKNEKSFSQKMISMLENKTNNAFSYYPYSLNNKEIYLNFSADKDGVLFNINFNKLEKFSKVLNECLQRGNLASIKTVKKEKKNNERFVRKIEGNNVKIGDALISISKDIIENAKEKDIKKLDKYFKNMFIVEEDNPHLQSDIDIEIREMTKEFKIFINKKESEDITAIVEVYLSLIKTSLKHLNIDNIGGEIKETGYPYQIISLITQGYDEALKEAVNTKDYKIIWEVFNFIPEAIFETIEAKNASVFEGFNRFYFFLYQYLEENKIDKMGRNVNEICSSIKFIEYKLSEKIKNDKTNNKTLEQFCISLIVLFQSLLKFVFEKQDVESFETFFDFEKDLLEQIKISDTENSLIMKKYQTYFGLAGWILDKILNEKNKDNLDKSKEFYSVIVKAFDEVDWSTYNALFNFVEIFTKLILDNAADDFSWNSWDAIAYMEKTGKTIFVSSVDFSEKLYCFFIAEFLSLMLKPSSGNQDTIVSFSVEEIKKLQIFLIEEIKKSLNKIKEKIDDFIPIIYSKNFDNKRDLENAKENLTSKIIIIENILQKAISENIKQKETERINKKTF